MTQQKGGRSATASLHFGGKCGQHGSKLAFQIDKKSIKIVAQIDQKFDAIKNLMHLGVDFWKVFGGF